MKILHSSDWHADWLTSGVNRFDDVERAVQQTVKVAVDERVGLYLFTGDLCDPEDGPRALRAVSLALWAATELAIHGISNWWVAGNHDVIEDGNGRTTLSPLSAICGQTGTLVFEEPAALSLPGYRPGQSSKNAILLPYPPASRPYDPAAFVRKHADENTVLVAGHMTELRGIEEGEESKEMARGRGVLFPFEECGPSWLLLNGHWHRGQTFESGGRRVHIPGSLARLNHGEEKSKPRFLILEI